MDFNFLRTFSSFFEKLSSDFRFVFSYINNKCSLLLVEPIAMLFFLPWALLNYCIVKSIIFLINRDSINIFNFNVNSLRKIKKFFEFQEIFIIVLFVIIRYAAIIFLASYLEILSNIFIELTLLCVCLHVFSEALQVLPLLFEKLNKYVDDIIDEMISNLSENINKKIIK